MEKEFKNFMVSEYKKEIKRLEEKRKLDINDFKENKEKHIIDFMDLYKDYNLSEEEIKAKAEELYKEVLEGYDKEDDSISLTLKAIKQRLKELSNED